MTERVASPDAQPQLDRRGADRVVKVVDRRAPEIVELLQQLVRIPSESHPPGGDEEVAQAFVEQLFRQLDLEVGVFEPWSIEGRREHSGWRPGSEYHDRPNVVGVFPGGEAGAG